MTDHLDTITMTCDAAAYDIEPGDRLHVQSAPYRWWQSPTRWYVRAWRWTLVKLRVRCWEDFGIYTVLRVDGGTVTLKPRRLLHITTSVSVDDEADHA